ncbi:MAG: hypothetical protein K0S07_1688, partial [Chlamydiales bacterium]|nr:hypothetical protein [Chlamydiales bacterium]
MERQKRWQLALIIAVILLTVYNILPTVFFYSKPLKAPVDSKLAYDSALEMVARVNQLEQETINWLKRYAKHLGCPVKDIFLVPDDPALVEMQFEKEADALLFAKYLPSAGELIPFAPAQLSLAQGQDLGKEATLFIERRVGVHLDPKDLSQLFHFTKKFNEHGQPESFYKTLLEDRLSQVVLALGGESAQARELKALLDSPSDADEAARLAVFAQKIIDIDRSFVDQKMAQRLYNHLAYVKEPNQQRLFSRLAARLDIEKNRLHTLAETAKQTLDKKQKEGALVEPDLLQRLETAEKQYQLFEEASVLLNRLPKSSNLPEPLQASDVQFALDQSAERTLTRFPLSGRHPFVDEVILDWSAAEITLSLYNDVEQIVLRDNASDADNFFKDRLNAWLVNECAYVARQTGEHLVESPEGYKVYLESMPNSQSVLALDLAYVASRLAAQIVEQIHHEWHPASQDFLPKNFPVRSYASYQKEEGISQKFGLVAIAPVNEPSLPLRKNSLFVIAKGLDPLISRWRTSQSPESKAVMQDFESLFDTLQRRGFIGYSGSTLGKDSPFSKDFIFELADYYTDLLLATRESFLVMGSKRYATLELSDYEQRLLTRNRIEDQIQEDVLRSKELHQAALVDINPMRSKLVPPPLKNSYVENCKLSLKKYFRGDDRRTLKWGLDLSGGKTVRIALRDASHKLVTDPEDLKQAVNELYLRINKMGVAERTIRIENNQIVLEFPGSQGLTAKELIEASAMYFHIVNEKFSTFNKEISQPVDRFLQGVWNEAVVSNRKDALSLNEIALRHLGGANGENPLDESARVLFEQGLRLFDAETDVQSAAFNDTISMVARMRGEDSSDWYGQNHPLLFVFRNYALEGSSLDGVQAGYDPSKGNILIFNVNNSYAKGSGSPRDDFYTWTSQYSENKIAGTPREAYSNGRGWRMAVILNGQVISSPSLNDALRESGMISGNFSQREAAQLAADLRAGSLSFTPEILSELNISPELGQQERWRGIEAALIGLVSVIALMSVYYRLAGIVASVAVLFNLLIMWGVLQNIGAALTLPGIAGIVLTIGMAVDANVLVFERIREEFKASGRLATAIQIGYNKAFSAIVDSNITTILAALILIQFDSGPIRGFAITLIIGIVSSMFTALFMTRYFFTQWSQRP